MPADKPAPVRPTDDADPESSASPEPRSPAEQIAAAKSAVRVRARDARCALHPDACREAADAAAQNLLALPELVAARIVLVYGATPEELDPAPALFRLRRGGAQIAYPRIEAPGVLGLHLVDHELELVPGPFKLAQPSEHARKIEREAVDVVVVPGVAFDLNGRRLGYGGGYYDQLLPELRADCLRVGYAYDEQLVERIPTEDHDAHVDVIVTPTRIVRVAAC